MKDDVVSIVMVTCGVNDYFLSCLQAIALQTYAHVEIIVIDNSLAAAVRARVSVQYPSVKIIASSRNLMYCEALNQGIAQSRGEYVLCLNDDVCLEPSFLSEALGGFKVSARVGMVTGKILRLDARTVDSTGMSLTLWRTPRERGYGEQDHGQFNCSGYVFAVNCAAALFRRKMLDDVREGENWFDPDFRIFFEDIDISWRGQRRGWSAYYVSKAVAFHVRGGTVRQNKETVLPLARRYLNDELNILLLRNRYLVLIKNEAWWRLLICLIPVMGYDMLAWGYVVIFRQRVFKGFWSDLSYFCRAWEKRLVGQRGCRQGPGEHTISGKLPEERMKNQSYCAQEKQ